MPTLEPLLTYYVGDQGFVQKFFINQNGAAFNPNSVNGTKTVKWWWKQQKPGAVAKSITWTNAWDGANGNRVAFIMPNGFLDTEADYDCNIEVYNDGDLVLHTDPDFIVRVKRPAGTHS